jgi:hypothetical protein
MDNGVKKKNRFVLFLTGFVLAAILLTTLSFPGGSIVHATVSAEVENATVYPQQTSIQMPAGSELYLYGYNTGGEVGSSAFQYGQLTVAFNTGGMIVASLAATTNDTNSFSTATGHNTVSGVGITGFKSYSYFFGYNQSNDARAASVSFNVTSPNELVVLYAIAGSESYIHIAGIPGLVLDASNINSTGWISSGFMPIAIAHSYLPRGTYTASELTSINSTQNASLTADLIGAFLFVPGTPPGNSQTGTSYLGGLLTVVVISVMVAAVAIVSLVVGIVIGKRMSNVGDRNS